MEKTESNNALSGIKQQAYNRLHLLDWNILRDACSSIAMQLYKCNEYRNIFYVVFA